MTHARRWPSCGGSPSFTGDHGATWTFDSVKQGCEVGGKATVSTTKCALAGTVGGCEHYIAAGTCDVTHYFAPVTTGVAQSTCTGSGGTFHPP